MSLPANKRDNFKLLVGVIEPSTRHEKWMESWIAEYPGAETKRKYRQRVTDFFEWAACDVTEVTRELLLDYREVLAANGQSVNSRRVAIVTITSFYNYLSRNWHGPDWPDLRRIRQEGIPDERHTRILTVDEVKQLLAAATGSDKVLLRFLYETAARVHEVCSVKWTDIAPIPGGAVVTLYCKGAKMRVIPIGAETWRMVDSLPRTGELIFPISEREVRKRVEAIRKAAGLTQPASPHWLRHARLSHLAAVQVAVTELRDFAGHASVATTNFYLHACGRLNQMPDTLGEDDDATGA